MNQVYNIPTLPSTLYTAARCAVSLWTFIVVAHQVLQLKWMNKVPQLFDRSRNQHKTAEGELAANQDDARRWIIAGFIGYGRLTNSLPKDRGVPTVIS